MALLPELNKNQTIDNVREFFDREVPRIKVMAGRSYTDVKSPTISDMPGASVYGNSSDEKMSNHTQATVYMNELARAIASMPQQEREFMTLRYLHDLTWLEVEQRTGYSTSRGIQIIQSAFLYFADAYSDVYELRDFKEC